MVGGRSWRALVVAGAFVLGGCAALGPSRVGQLPEPATPSAKEVAEHPCRYGDLARCQAQCATDVAACNASGLLLELQGQSEAFVAAAQFYGHACDDAYPPACNNLAWLYALGRGVPRDAPRSLMLFARAYDGYRLACAQGDASGCLEAAAMLLEGRGVEPDEALASLYVDAAGRASARHDL